jgi:hypothetical protein
MQKFGNVGLRAIMAAGALLGIMADSASAEAGVSVGVGIAVPGPGAAYGPGYYPPGPCAANITITKATVVILFTQARC